MRFKTNHASATLTVILTGSEINQLIRNEVESRLPAGTVVHLKPPSDIGTLVTSFGSAYRPSSAAYEFTLHGALVQAGPPIQAPPIPASF